MVSPIEDITGLDPTIVVLCAFVGGTLLGELLWRFVPDPTPTPTIRTWTRRAIGGFLGVATLGLWLGQVTPGNDIEGHEVIVALFMVAAGACLAAVSFAASTVVRFVRPEALSHGIRRRLTWSSFFLGVVAIAVIDVADGRAWWWYSDRLCHEFGCLLYDRQVAVLEGFGISASALLVVSCPILESWAKGRRRRASLP